MNKLRDLFAKFQFWYAEKWIKYDVHYTYFLDLENPSAFSVKILKRYPDTVIEFSNLKITEDGLMVFDMDVLANPKLHNTNSDRFKGFTSDIMRNMVLNSINNAKENDENRNNDFNQLDSERGLHEESPAVPEERVSKRKPRKKNI